MLSRSPLAQIDAIALLTELKACYRAVKREPPPAIDAMLAMLVPPLSSSVDFLAFGPDADSAIVNMILNMHRLRIEKPGKYLLRLRIDQIEACLLPLYIRDSTPKEPNPLAK